MSALFSYLSVLVVSLSSLIARSPDTDDPYAQKRFKMVEDQIIPRGITDSSVIKAMLKVPRQEFTPKEYRGGAYSDAPIPLEMGQTVSQPYMVALMTELLKPGFGMKILEIGTGSGYQSAVLAELGCHLYTIEIHDRLAKCARRILDGLGYKDIKYKIGDGYGGWQEFAPFDRIIVTAAPGRIPDKLIEQLKTGGRMVIPVGDKNQELMLIEKTTEGIKHRKITSVRFVPMTGGDETGG